MNNEKMELAKVEKPDLKDRFQIGLVLRVAQACKELLDIGSGSGRFLFHIRRRFVKCLGIEVSSESVRFSRDKLELKIDTQLSDANVGKPSVITAWHSLEHIPTTVLFEMLETLSKASDHETRVVVSVPNRASLHFALFGARSAYYDAGNHLHQFSTRSMKMLFARFGFVPVSLHTSLGYSWIGAALSVPNLFTTHNYMYLSLRRRGVGHTIKDRLLIGVCVMAALASLLPTSLLYLFEKVFPARGGVLTIVFRKS